MGIWELTAEITYVKGSVIVVLNRELCKNPGLPALYESPRSTAQFVKSHSSDILVEHTYFFILHIVLFRPSFL